MSMADGEHEHSIPNPTYDGRADAHLGPEDFENFVHYKRAELEGDLNPEEETRLRDK
jgi:hypothetical protein